MEKLRDVLDYDRETGAFTWAVNVGRKMRAGSVAGTKKDNGYISIIYRGKAYKAHRVAWFFLTGNEPSLCIDHINGIRDDNRACNLREVTAQGNQHNQRTPNKKNTSGLIGVTYDKSKKRWSASICVDRKRINLGRFKEKEAAGVAYLEAKRLLHKTCTI